MKHMSELIYIQKPEKKPEQIMKVIIDRLKQEEHFESVIKQQSFRACLLRDILNKIENETH